MSDATGKDRAAQAKQNAADAKAERVDERADAKAAREQQRAQAKAEREANRTPEDEVDPDAPHVDNTLPGDLPPNPDDEPHVEHRN